MAAVELPLSLNSPNSLYRQSESLYRQSGAADKIYRQQQKSLSSSSSSSELHVVVGEQPQRQSSISNSPFCGLAGLQVQAGLPLPVSSPSPSPSCISSNHNNKRSNNNALAEVLSSAVASTSNESDTSTLELPEQHLPLQQQRHQPMDYSTVDAMVEGPASSIFAHPSVVQQQQQKTSMLSPSTPPAKAPMMMAQLAWTTKSSTSASTTTSACSTSKAPSTTRKIRNPKLKLKIAPLRQLSLTQQRLDEARSPSSGFPMDSTSDHCYGGVDATSTTPLGPICESPVVGGENSFYSSRIQPQQQQQQQHPHHQYQQQNSQNNNNRSRVGALFHHQMSRGGGGTPPQSAPPSVSSTPIYFPPSASPASPFWHGKISSSTPSLTQAASRVLPNVYLGSEADAADLDYLKASNITHVLNVSTHIPCFHENIAAAAAASSIPSSSSSSSSSSRLAASTNHSTDEGVVIPTSASFDALLNDEINKREEEASSSSSSSSSIRSSSFSSPWRLKYKRLAASDNASQNLAQYFVEAFRFIEEALRQKTAVLIHCQAGISRSSTILIAFIMSRTSLSMFQAYKFVKAKRNIISPNLNFMGQLLEFEQKLTRGEGGAVGRSVTGGGGSGEEEDPPLLGEELAAFAKASAAASAMNDEDADGRFDSL